MTRAALPLRRSLLGGVLGGLVAAVILTRPAVAQWHVGIDVGSYRTWGASKEVTPTEENPSFRPYWPTALGVRLERRGHRLSVGLGASYAKPGLAGETKSAIVVAKEQLSVISLAPEVGFPVARVSQSGELRVNAGPLLELWDVVGSGYRPRLGAQAALGFLLPLGGRFSGTLRATGAVVPASPFEMDDLPEEFDRAALWRAGFSLGIRYRL